MILAAKIQQLIAKSRVKQYKKCQIETNEIAFKI